MPLAAFKQAIIVTIRGIVKVRGSPSDSLSLDVRPFPLAA